MSYPLTVPLTLKRRVLTNSVDPLNNPTEGYSPDERIYVFAWYIGSSSEVITGGHEERVVIDATAYPATEAGVSAYDRIELPGIGWCQVIGQPKAWDANPWWPPGLVECHLKRVNG